MDDYRADLYGKQHSHPLAVNFRNYEACPEIERFYAQNHQEQTVEYVLQQKRKYETLNHAEMGVWEAMEMLNRMIDDSDPDTSLSQIEHCFQVAESARKQNHPRWFQLTCLIHDLGKILFFFGEPQWGVVGMSSFLHIQLKLLNYPSNH